MISAVTAAKFTALLATVKSHEPLCDIQFRGRIVDVVQPADAAFALTAPVGRAGAMDFLLQLSRGAEDEGSAAGRLRPRFAGLFV